MKALFVVNGLGLGNATRCHAVIAALAARGVEVTVATSGNGLWYLGRQPEVARVIELEAMHYGAKDGRLSVWNTVASGGRLIGTLRRNARRLAALLEEERFDVAVLDSAYSISPLKRAGVPICAINNSDVVHAAWRQFPDRPASIRAQFYVVEENDLRFHRLFVDRVISPCLDPALPTVPGPFVRVPPIVRPSCRRVATEAQTRVVVMLSGSVLGTPVALRPPPPGVVVDVVGRPAPEGPVPDGIRYHGKVSDSLEILRGASLAVVNGGFSAVSEVFVMRLPAVVIPVPNHAEQWLNAASLRQLGVGRIGDDRDVDGCVADGLAHLDAMRAAYARLPAPGDGAAAAADVVIGAAARKLEG